MAEPKFYTFLNDFVFKAAFGQEQNKGLLICLLNALLDLSPEHRIEDLRILNPFNLKEFPESKYSIVDVKATDAMKRQFNIEVQVNPESDFIKRVLYYAAKLYAGQITEGDDYFKLCKTTGISILDFTLLGDQARLHSIFRLRDIETHLDLTDVLELHFIELSKFQIDKPRSLRTRFEKWLYILKRGEEFHAMGKALPKELREEEGISGAVDVLRKINADREMRQILEVREKERLTRNTFLRAAREEGREKGREEGQRLIVHAMVKRGKTLEEITDFTGLSLAEIKALTKK